MRPHVPFLDTHAMEWETSDEMVGLFTKPLSHDPETGARTALQRIDTKFGYAPPPTAHYHHMDEELFVLKGRFTFDGENWVGPMAYCYHPAQTVHGFRSQVDDEAWFISRVSKELDFNLEQNPRQFVPYSPTGEDHARDVRIIADPRRERWAEMRDESGSVVASRLVLSESPVTHEGAMLVRYAPGYRSPHSEHVHSVYHELFVYEGELAFDDGKRFTAGCYAFHPPGTVIHGFSSPTGALVYVNYGGVLDYKPVPAQAARTG